MKNMVVITSAEPHLYALGCAARNLIKEVELERNKVPYLSLSLENVEALADFILSRTITEEAGAVLKKLDKFLDDNNKNRLTAPGHNGTDDFTEDEWQQVVNAAFRKFSQGKRNLSLRQQDETESRMQRADRGPSFGASRIGFSRLRER